MHTYAASRIFIGLNLVLFAAGEAALAQGGIEEIIVTARKREENLQTVPLAITAITERELFLSGARGMEDLAAMTPGLSFYELGDGTILTPMIRGVSQINKFTNEGTVAVFLDGVYLANRDAINIQLLDFARVEVLKGPQATMYGREAFSGAINYVTMGPTDTWKGYVEGSFGTDKWVDGRFAIGGPIVEDKVGVRIAASANSFDGTFRNEAEPSDKLSGNESTNIAATVLFTPTPDLDVTLRGYYSNDNIENGARYNAANNCGLGPRNTRSSICGPVPTQETVDISPDAYGAQRDSKIASATIDYRIGNITLTSQTGYTDAYSSSLPDHDLTSLGWVTTATNTVTGATRTVRSNSYFGTGSGNIDMKTLSQELRAAYEDERLSVIVGGFFIDINRDRLSTYGSDISMLGPNEIINFQTWTRFGVRNNPAQNPTINSAVEQDERETSAFAAIQYNVTSALRVNVEGRYRRQKQENTSTRALNAPVNPPRVDRGTFKVFSPRFSADYKASDDIFFYASAAKGIRSGGFNATISPNAPQDATFDEEKNWTYELGSKATWLDGRLTTNGAIFYSDVSGLQVIAPSSDPAFTVLRTANAGSGKVKGFEIDIDAAFTDEFTAGVGYSYSDSEFDDGTLDRQARNCGLDRTICRFTAAGIPDISGNRFPLTPRAQFDANATYMAPLTGDWTWSIRGDTSYHGNAFTDQDNVTSFGKRWLVNARLGVQRDQLDISFWAKNLFDKRYVASAFTQTEPSGGARVAQAQLGRGRVMGFTARMGF